MEGPSRFVRGVGNAFTLEFESSPLEISVLNIKFSECG